MGGPETEALASFVDDFEALFFDFSPLCVFLTVSPEPTGWGSLTTSLEVFFLLSSREDDLVTLFDSMVVDHKKYEKLV